MLADVADARIDDLVRGRRSIRRFRDEPVPREVVRALLEVSCWAPSPHNSQPWRFTVLFERPDKERLARSMAERLARELRADGLPEEEIERQKGRSSSRIGAAPVVILVSLLADGLVRYPDARRTHLEWQMAVQSVGTVVQTLFLAAEARGLGTCWMAAPMYCPDVVREALDLPADWAPQALVLMGYADGPGRVRDRRTPAEVLDFR